MSTKIVKRIIFEKIDKEYQGFNISFDEFLQIMLLRSFDYYDPRNFRTEFESLINVYQTFVSANGLEKLIIFRIMILSLRLADANMFIDKCNIIKTVSRGLEMPEEKVEAAIGYLLRTDTFESPDGNNVVRCNILFPTRKMWYYINKLSKYITYVKLIRNDLYLNYECRPSKYGDRLDFGEIREYLLFIDWIRRIEINELKYVSEKHRSDYLQLLSDKPVCIKLLKSLISRINKLLKDGLLAYLETKEAGKLIEKLYNEMKRNINEELLLPEFDIDYFKAMKDGINSIINNGNHG